MMAILVAVMSSLFLFIGMKLGTVFIEYEVVTKIYIPAWSITHYYWNLENVSMGVEH